MSRFGEFLQGFKKALPWLMFACGLLLLIIGEFMNLASHKDSIFDFTPEKIQQFITGLGKVVLISGVTTITLDSYKFLGIFKEELGKVISEPEFINNRKDLDIYWEKVTKHMFKNKFPTINTKIIKDIKETYLPTTSVQYYDDYKQTIEIKLIDPINDIVQVTQTNKFLIIPLEAKTKFSHEFSNSITCGKHPNMAKFHLVKFKVNDKDQDVSIKNIIENNCLTSSYDVTLEGKSGYNIEITVKKEYSLKDDNMIGTLPVYIRNNFRVQFFLAGVELKVYSAGTLNNFKTINDRPGFLEVDYHGLIYPKQGYIGIINKI